jgi:Flp pilus assembly protein CpaB
MLEAGRRAYPLEVSDNQVPLEELCAGDRVDLVFVPPEGRASVILHSVTVLCLPSAGQARQEEWDAYGALPSLESGSPGHVLLSLTPDEAETLAEAEERGRVLLAVCPAAR